MSRAASRHGWLMSLVAGGAMLAACSVQLVSPYEAQLATDAGAFQEQFLTFVADMAGKAGTPAGTAEANEATYNALMAKLTAMQSLSELTQPPIDCGKIAERVGNSVRTSFPQIATVLATRDAGEAAAANSGSCQTRLIVLIERQLLALRQIQASDCAPGSAVRFCRSIWGPSYTFQILSLDPESRDPARRSGRPVFFVLSAVRALIYVLDVKKSDRS